MDTGKFGIISLQSSYLSSSDTKLYVFSNNTFSTRESTYNIGIKSNCYGYPISRACYGYGNNLIWPLDGPGYTYLPYLNYVSDGAIQTINLSVTPASSQFASNGLGFGYLARGTIPINPYLVAGLTGLYNSYSTSYGASAVVDLSTLTQVSQINAPINYDSNYPAIIDPTITDTTAIAYSAPLGNIRFLQYTGAVTSKKLDTPVVKTSANGMTVTYELEVFL